MRHRRVPDGRFHRFRTRSTEGHDVLAIGGRADRLGQSAGQPGRAGADAALRHERRLLIQPRCRHPHQCRMVVPEQRCAEPADQIQYPGTVSANQPIPLGARVNHVEVTGAQ